ncbi:hypothetical protein [Shewanella polaris]|uniref:hypothetical protein n=1 Tax=Shewanella polaris TaxID=2588449 RepID=UPI00197F45CB|nr:hypothetical protein [Shewanella polaris]
MSTVAMLICISLLHMPSYTVVAEVYSLTLYLGAGLLVIYASYSNVNRNPVIQPTDSH